MSPATTKRISRPRTRAPRRNTNRQQAPRRAKGSASGARNLSGNIYQQQSNRATDAITIKGHDIVKVIGDINAMNVATGSAFYRIPIVPTARDIPTAEEPQGAYIFPRLQALSKNFQDIKYHSLDLIANGSATLLTTGDAGHAFCADPSDDIPGGLEGVSWVSSQACSATAKYSQDVRFRVPAREMVGMFNGSYKTSISNSLSPRTYSPGFFAGVAITQPDAKAPMSIKVDWHVTLSKATTHTLADEIEVRSVKSLYGLGIKGNATADTPYEPNMQSFVNGVEREAVAADFNPVLLDGIKYQLDGGEVTVAGNTGASGAPEAFIATHLGVKVGRVRLFRFLVSNETFEEVTLTAQPLPGAAPTWQAGSTFKLEQAAGFGS